LKKGKEKGEKGELKNKNAKTFLLLLFVVLLGTALRLIFINKPDGLWNDEYVSWAIASIPISKKFFEAILAQCHMPLYYFYLKFFIHFFGNSDLMLRLTSVIVGIFSIISMYLVGKEYKDEKLGILCASIASISSFLIYFSQEVRFYQLLFLFSAFSLYFTIKLGRNQTRQNLIGYLLSNFLIIITHTIGLTFVILNSLFLSKWIIKTNENYKNTIRKFWIIFIIIGLTFIPIAHKTMTSHPFSQWWGHFSISKIGFLFTDYFSPILTNIVSAPDNFFHNLTMIFIIFAIIPTLIALSGIVKTIKTKNYEILGLFYISLAFITVLILLAIFGKVMFITKYSIEIYPILILIMSYGLFEFSKNKRQILIFIFCFLNLFYLIASSHSAPKLHRSEGHKLVANLLKNADLNKNDIILINYYPQDRFEKYFDFKDYRVTSINKGSYVDYVKLNPNFRLNNPDNAYFREKFKSKIINRLKINQKIAIVILNDVAIYSPMQVQGISSDEKSFSKTPYLFYVFSYLKNETLNECLNSLQILRIEQKGSWTVATFQK